MKKSMVVACIILLGVINATGQSKTIQVKSDKLLNQDFSNYKTFAFSTMIDSDLEPGVYFVNDLILKKRIREAVNAELMGLGYTLDRENPDLVVNFRVFEEPTTLKGFEGYGESYWGATEQYRQISDQAFYDVEAGTLLISIVDRKSSQLIWQGFASGLIDDNKFKKEEATIREAVNLIFDEYEQRAKEYTKK